MTLQADNLTLPSRLRGISLTLNPGELTAIVGPNGAGKSSLLAALAGLLPPQSGTVLLDGQPMPALPPRARARHIGYLPQSPEIAWDVTVETLVSLGRLPWQGAPLHRSHTAISADIAAIDAALAAMDLTGLRHRGVASLSGGERARTLAARVFAGEPEWLLADEPLANLDLAHGASLIARLKREARLGKGVVVVLHDLAAAMNNADRVVVLEAGRIAADGPPPEALDPKVIAQVWGVQASWLGNPGARALALG